MKFNRKDTLAKAALILTSVLCLLAPAHAQVGLPTNPTDLTVTVPVPDTSWHGKPVDWSSTTWSRTEVITNQAGQGWTTNLHQYTEVGDGINFIDYSGPSLTGTWRRSVDEIQLMTTNELGGAAALQGATRVYFSPTIGADGPTLHITTCSNVVLQVQPAAIYYTDDSGTNVLLANIRPDAEGELLPPNRIVYRSVTTNGLKCDIVYTYTHGSFDSDLLILSQPAQAPETLGLDPSTAKISLVHLVNGPLPTQTSIVTSRGLSDTRLDFAGLSFPQGHAFLTGDSGDTNAPSPGTSDQIQLPGGGSDNGVPVSKSIIPIGLQQWGLAEDVRWMDIQPKLQTLPPYGPGANLSTPLKRIKRTSLEWPKPAPKRAKAAKPKPTRVASADYHPKAVDLDFITIVSGTTFTFSSGSTYFLASSATFSSTVNFYANCVIKETNGAYLYLTGPVNCYSSSQNPAVITSMHDWAFGEKNLPGSTGYPAYAGNPSLRVGYTTSALTLAGLKIRWGQVGLEVDGNGSGLTHALQNSSIEWCSNGVYLTGCNLSLQSASKCTVTNATTGTGTYYGAFTDICSGTDPANNLPYSWEFKYFGQSGINASADPDGDGFNNSQEYSNGTNPQVYDGPMIQEQPQNQLIALGNIATFTVIATGTGTLSYQWYKGGQPITGATTNSYIITSVQVTNSGSYFVVVTNLYGVVSSTTVSLSVALPGSGVPAPVGIVGWWPGQNNANDAVSTNNGIFSGSYVAGKVGNAFSVVSTASAVRIPAAPALNVGTNVGLTLEGWINPANTSGEPVFEWAPTNTYGVHVWINFQGTGSVWVNLVDTSGNSHIFQSANSLISSGTFQHLAVTYDKISGYLQLFVNGSQKTNILIGVFTPQTGVDFWLGCRPSNVNGSAASFNGVIDEVSLYSRPLFAGEIQAIYNAGSSGKYLSPGPPTITSQPQSISVGAGSSATFTVAASGASPLSYQWIFNGTGIGGATATSYTLQNAQASNVGPYAAIVANSGGSVLSANALLTLNNCVLPPANLVSWWRAENNPNDSVGSNTGQLMGGATYAAGEVGQAFSLSGSSGCYVQVPSNSSLQLSNAFTLEFWFKDTGSSGWYGLMAKRSTTSPYPCNFGINATVSGNYMQVYFLDPTTSSSFQISTISPLPTANVMHHVAAVYQQINGSQVQIQTYIDGTLKKTDTFNGKLGGTFDNSPVTIGASNSSGEFFKGLVDEASIYSRALSSSEIQGIYYAGGAGKCTSVLADSSGLINLRVYTPLK